MRINVSAGHNPDGKVACGAVGLLKESTEARRVTNEVVRLLKEQGHTVYNCTCDNGTSQGDVLKKIVAKCNQHSVDLDVSIHFNAGASAQKKDGKTTGIEVLVYREDSKSVAAAQRVAKQISALGFKNRGVKIRNGLYFLRKTKSPAMLVECCFVDDGDDAALYDYKKMAAAIAQGITGVKASEVDQGERHSTERPGKRTEAARSRSSAYNRSYKTTANLNLRSGAGTGKDIILTIPKGKAVICYGYYTAVADTVWLYVKYGQHVGFVSKDYLI